MPRKIVPILTIFLILTFKISQINSLENGYEKVFLDAVVEAVRFSHNDSSTATLNVFVLASGYGCGVQQFTIV